MNFFDVSVIAIILCVVANTVIGALWYSPLLFSKKWLASMGKSMEELNKSGANVGYAITMFAALITAYALSLLIQLFETPTITDGALIGIITGLGIASMRELSPTFFEGRRFALFFISAGYHIVSLTVMGIIIAAFS